VVNLFRVAGQAGALVLMTIFATSGGAGTGQPSLLPLATARVLPDGASGAVPGKGWTCTGLARDPVDGSWWAGNDGRGDAPSDPHASSILHLSPDFSTILGEVTTRALSLPDASIQGVGYDNASNSIWFVLKGDPVRLINVAKDGALRRSLSVSGRINGLAYDTRRHLLITVDDESGEVRWRDPTTGALNVQPRLRIRGRSSPDHLFYDGARDALLVTGGANGRAGWLETWRLDTAEPSLVRRERLANADAIEGIARFDGRYYLANDGFFHRGAPSLNRILTYVAPDDVNS
jgi:hypothetical protein